MRTYSHFRCKFCYSLYIVKPDGKEIFVQESDRLITDAGLNKIATTTIPDCFTTMLLDNTAVPTPVRRDSGSTTITRSGTTATASGNFFDPTDVGRLLKLNSGEEMYITAYTSALIVTVSVSGTISTPSAGTIWYVNRTALDASVLTGATYDSAGGANQSTFSGANITHKRTIVSNAASGPLNLTAIAFNGSTSNVNVFDIDIILGGISLTTGDKAKAVVQFVITYSPITPISQANVGTGLDTTGTMQIESLDVGNHGLSYVQSDGLTNAGRLDVCGDASTSCGLITSAITLQTFDFINGASVSYNTIKSLSDAGSGKSSYTAGTFTIDWVFFFDTPFGNAAITGFSFTSRGPIRCVTVKLDSTFTKTSSQTLTLTWNWTWSRVLTN